MQELTEEEKEKLALLERKDPYLRPKLDWKTLPEGKEKYQAYLCSREWAEIKNDLKDAVGDYCQRCGLSKIECIHHLTYIRKYKENPEDLIGLCNACHAYTDGKSDVDPIEEHKAPEQIKFGCEYTNIVCPKCGYNMVRINEVKNEGDLFISMWGECGHKFEIRIMTDRGMTHIHTVNAEKNERVFKKILETKKIK